MSEVVHKVKISPFHYHGLISINFWMFLALRYSSVLCFVISIILLTGLLLEVVWTPRVLNNRSPGKLRQPFSPLLSYFFSFHNYWNFIIHSLSNLVCLIAVIFVFGTKLSFGLVISIFFASLAGFYWGLRSISSIVRALLAGRTRCIVFRRFSKNSSEDHRATILPIIGVYAYPVCYNDSTMMEVIPESSWVNRDLFANYFTLMPEGEKNWKSHVKSQLPLMDYAVFDWTEAPTETMIEELEWAKELVPQERIAIIFSKTTSDVVDTILRKQHFDPKYKFILNENRIEFSKSMAYFFGQVDVP